MSLVFTFVGYDHCRYLAGDRRVLDGSTVWGDGSSKVADADCFAFGAVGSQSDYFCLCEVMSTVDPIGFNEYTLSEAVREHEGFSKDFEGMIIRKNGDFGDVFLVDRGGSCCRIVSSIAAIGCGDLALGYMHGVLDWSQEEIDPKELAKHTYDFVRNRETSVGGGLDLIKLGWS